MSPHPVVKGLPQVVHRQLLDAQEDQCVRSLWDAAQAHGPAGNRITRSGEAAAGEGAERLLQHGVYPEDSDTEDQFEIKRVEPGKVWCSQGMERREIYAMRDHILPLLR
jgi:hypothetical protein